MLAIERDVFWEVSKIGQRLANKTKVSINKIQTNAHGHMV